MQRKVKGILPMCIISMQAAVKAAVGAMHSLFTMFMRVQKKVVAFVMRQPYTISIWEILHPVVPAMERQFTMNIMQMGAILHGILMAVSVTVWSAVMSTDARLWTGGIQ